MSRDAPVMFPPGLAVDFTKPDKTGYMTAANTVGTWEKFSWANLVAELPIVSNSLGLIVFRESVITRTLFERWLI